MPTITEIAPQKKRQDFYSIYVDEKYAFSVSSNSLLTFGLFKGQELTHEQLDQISLQAEEAKAYDRALSYIAMRKRSMREVKDYLRRKSYTDETIQHIIDRLEASKLLDDLDFAKSWVRDRQLLKPSSRRKLEAELKQKGISPTVLDEVLGEYGAESELEAAAAMAKKKAHLYQDEQKLIQYLMSQGFSYSTVKSALETI